MTAWLLPVGADRYWRHQLSFELGAAALLGALTGRWDLVSFIGAICLPAVRAAWISWVRAGIGLVPGIGVMVVASARGLLALFSSWLLVCAIGIARRWWQERWRLAASERNVPQRGPRTRT
ncbi:MAG: hypothetical protein JWO77_901 [Ilumatobacteraceae bacterium]|nr:hypothetical protein [Ilumatobacteraceae bacterium]